MVYKTIGVLGDSIADGYWDEEGKGGWFGRLSERLTREFPYQYGFNNMAKAGDRIVDVFHRLAVEAFTKEADILLISVGVNDIVRSPDLSSPTDMSEHMRWEYWTRMLDLAAKSGAEVVVTDILPVCEERYPVIRDGNIVVYRTNADIEVYNKMLERLCIERKIKFIKRYNNWTDRDICSLYRDTAHPNAQGHQIIADEIYSFLKYFKVV